MLLPFFSAAGFSFERIVLFFYFQPDVKQLRCLSCCVGFLFYLDVDIGIVDEFDVIQTKNLLI